MSGNRILHREQVGAAGDALWGLTCTTCSNVVQDFDGDNCSKQQEQSESWMLWTTGSASSDDDSDGSVLTAVRGYVVEEMSLLEKQDNLKAAALRLRCTHHCIVAAATFPATGASGSPSSNSKNDESEDMFAVPDIVTETDSDTILGGSCLSTIRNYTGDDRNAGDWLLLCMDLSNVVRIWNLSNKSAIYSDNNKSHNSPNGAPPTNATTSSSSPLRILPYTSFKVKNATGTTAALLPPRLAGTNTRRDRPADGAASARWEDVVVVAIGCLDGTVALLSSGIPVFNPHRQHQMQQQQPQRTKMTMDKLLIPAGTVLETWNTRSANGGTANSTAQDIPLCLVWNPTVPFTLAVGSGTGTVHIFSRVITASEDDEPRTKHYRLNHFESSFPVRAVAFTTDGNLLIAGNDQGRLCIWDVTCSFSATSATTNNIRFHPPALIHHVNAHSTWVLQIAALDARRFCTMGANKTISIWNVSQMHHPVHTFQSNRSLWSLATTLFYKPMVAVQEKLPPRLAAGSDDGWVEMFSLEVNS